MLESHFNDGFSSPPLPDPPLVQVHTAPPPPLSNLLSFISIGVGIFDNDTADAGIDFFSPRYSSAAQPRWRPGRLTSFTSTSSDAGCHGDGSKRRGKVGCLAVIGWEPSGRLSLSYRRESARAIH
ncbi:uncharacterized protein CDAR_51721 [Caerostris darwini]|uniref:Uncharacterized protein n=1 Tax=Caerostris darwini TaxID=1538125 RepID=A0AAV4V6U0_9ARAC|nr:uncharacterized protein CDAR_51721 [Caerostris darwini]